MSERIVYFPFAPGIPYIEKGGGWVDQKMDPHNWDKLFSDRNVTFLNNGGFLEQILSLPIIEAINKIKPSNKLYHVSSRFSSIYSTLGLTRERNIKFTDKMIEGYPVPAFLDAKDNVYVNCLYRYLSLKDYNGNFKYHRSIAASKQVFSNLMVNWDSSYFPNFRNEVVPEGLERLESRRYILVLPESTGFSSHFNSYLNWSVQDVKSFVSMASNSGYKVVICTNNKEKYYGINSVILPIRVDFLLYLVRNASLILSKEVDYLLSSLLLSDALIISNLTYNEFKLEKNKKYLNSKNNIISFDNVRPIDVFNIL